MGRSGEGERQGEKLCWRRGVPCVLLYLTVAGVGTQEAEQVSGGQEYRPPSRQLPPSPQSRFSLLSLGFSAHCDTTQCILGVA